MFSNLTGWHLAIIGLVLLPLIILVVVAVILIARRRQGPQTVGTTAGSPPDASARLGQIAELRDRGQLTDAEYEAKRRQIMDGL